MWREGDPKLARAKRIGPVWTCVVCGISIILSLSLLESKSRWAASLVTIPTIFVNIGYFWVESRTTKAKENLRRKVTASKFYTVTLAIRLRNVSIGDDFGYLWVEDGLLCFEGNQTSFKLPNTLKGLHAQKKKDYSPEHLLFFKADSGLEAELKFTGDFGAVMSDAIRKWQTGPAPAEGAVMPPMTLKPQVIPSYLMRVMLAEFLLIVGGLECLLWLTLAPQFIGATLFAMIMILILVGSLGAATAWQAKKRSELRIYLDSQRRLGGS